MSTQRMFPSLPYLLIGLRDSPNRIGTKMYEVFFSEHFKEKVANYLFVMAILRSTAGSPLAF